MGDIANARDIASRQGWLAQTPPDFRRAVFDRAVLQDFDAGATIYATDAPPGGVYGLVSGRLNVLIAPGGRGPYPVYLFNPGDWFGEGPIITGRGRIAGMAAVRKSQLLYLSLRAIEEILAEQPATWRLFAGLVMAKLEVALSTVDDLMIPDGFKRTVATLLRLARCRRETPAGPLPIAVEINQGDLAIMANVSRATVSANLRRLESSGDIELAYRRICIVSPDRMRAALSE